MDTNLDGDARTDADDADDVTMTDAPETVAMLAAILADATALDRLHELERMIVTDLYTTRQRRRCPGCIRLIEALHRKAFP